MGKKANVLTLLVLVGLLAGVLIGHFVLWDPNISEALRTEHTQPWRTAGDFVFIRPLKLLIIPLVFTSVLTGIASIGSPQRLGLLGGATLLYYLVTMVMAVTLGVTLGAALKPGAGVPSEALAAAETTAAPSVVPSAPDTNTSSPGRRPAARKAAMQPSAISSFCAMTPLRSGTRESRSSIAFCESSRFHLPGNSPANSIWSNFCSAASRPRERIRSVEFPSTPVTPTIFPPPNASITALQMASVTAPCAEYSSGTAYMV